MICALCNELVKASDKKKIYTQGKEYTFHKQCLRKATKQDLLEKGLIKSDDWVWWIRRP